jgi:hypothetical protein
VPHNRNRDYAGDARKLGIDTAQAERLDHETDDWATDNPSPQGHWTNTSSNLDVVLSEWSRGWPLGWETGWPNAQVAANWVDSGDGEPVQFDKVPLMKPSGQPEVLSYATARAHAAAIIGASPREHRQFEVVKEDDTWSYYFTTPFFDAPRNPEDAKKAAAELNDGEISTEDGKYHWVVGAKDTDGYYHIRRERVLEEDEDDDDPKFDPANPLQYETWPDGTHKRDLGGRKIPIKIDLPDGSSYFVLSDNRLVHSGPPKEDEDAWIESITDPGAVKTVTVGEDTFLVWPDGTKTQVGAKFTGDIKPEDIIVESEQQLKDGTWISILNNGQIFRLGREESPAEVGWDEELKKFKITQPDGSIRFEEAADPTYDPGLVTISTPLGDRYFFEQRTGDFDELGLPEVPSTIETIDDQQFIRGTKGELLPLNDVLDRVIEQAVINGDIDKAIAFDDFRKRPSRTEALKMALEFARSPADQVLISAISSGEQYIAPPSAGTLQRVGPQADFLVQAYEEFRATLTGGRLPTTDEFQQALAGPPPPEPTELEIAQLETANLQNDLIRTQIANLERTAKNAEDKTAEAIASSEATTVRNDNAAASKTENADKITASKISATTGAVTVGGNGGNGGIDKIPVGDLTPVPKDQAYDKFGNPVSLGDDERLSDEQNAFFEDQGLYTGDMTAENMGFHLRNAMHASGNSELGIKITEKPFDRAVQAAQDKHFADYNAAREWAATLSPEVRNKFGGTASRMMEAHQVALAEDARQTREREREEERGNIETIITEDLGDVRGREGGGPSGPGGSKAYPSGVGLLKGGGLSGYGEGMTFGDVEAAIKFREAAADPVDEVDPIAAARSERMDLASALAEARGAAGPRTNWETNTGVIAAEEAFDVATEKYNTLRGLAGGGRVGSQEMALVGESGPEVALFPNGTEIIPLDRNVKPDQARRLRRRGIRGMQNGGDLGGDVFPIADDIGQVEDVDLSRYGGVLPSGVRRTIAGQGIRPSRGYLSRAAGIGLPSGQALRNMLPEELDVLKDIGAQTGIPERAFERELALGIPSGERQRGSARFLPLSLRS